METNNIFDGVFDRMIEDEAWQNLSSSYPFSAELLEKYRDRLDWHKVSGNSNICWTVAMLEKFRKLIDWRELSESSQESGKPFYRRDSPEIQGLLGLVSRI